jgi:hypothetical protein
MNTSRAPGAVSPAYEIPGWSSHATYTQNRYSCADHALPAPERDSSHRDIPPRRYQQAPVMFKPTEPTRTDHRHHLPLSLYRSTSITLCQTKTPTTMDSCHPLEGTMSKEGGNSPNTVCPPSATVRNSVKIPQLDGSDERYVRRNSPTKEALFANTGGNLLSDPFSPSVKRNTRMAQQFTTLRSSSLPTVWSVGGSAVTEGVASTSNGRGGRVTSGSNAPHYAAEFLQRRSQTEETLTHGRRLAHAMEISQSGRIVEQVSTPSSPVSSASSSPGSPTQVS